MVKHANRAKMTTASTGTSSPLTLGSAADGYQSFADAGVSNGDTVRYVIEDGNNFEIGTGTYTASGTTLSRSVTESSNSDSAINLSGNASVFLAVAAQDLSPTVTLSGAVTGSGTLTDLGDVTITTTATSDPTITLSGDASGSATLTNLASATLSVTVADDSHNHVISNVDGLQSALDGKLSTSGNAATATTAGTVTTAAQPNITSVGTLSTLTVDEITINGDTITATDDFIIDVASDIKLDANGGHINFFDNGTPILSFQNSSTDAVIWSRASDRDMIFKGNDGGSVITGLTLDFSDAGTAIFNHDIKLADNNKAIFGASSDLQIYHDTTYNHSIIEETGSGNLTLKGDNLFLTRQGSGDNYLGAVADGAVTLYYDGTSKLATTANGINVAGDVVVTNDIYVADQIIHEGDTDTYFAFDTNEINIYSGGTHHARFNTNDFITYSALKEDYDALSGTSPTIDVDAGGGFSLTTSGNTTFTFSSCTSGVAVGFVLQVTAGGSHSLTWPGTVDWAGGSAPDAPASGESNLYVFYTRDGGSNWIGVLSAAAYG